MMFEKVLDEIKEKSFKEQTFELNIDVVKRQYNITLNEKKSLEYVTKLFYPNGVNGIKIIEETELKNGKKEPAIMRYMKKKERSALFRIIRMIHRVSILYWR